MKKYIAVILSLLIFTSAHAGMSKDDKSKAWDCIGIYMANYFLPSGEKFEYGMKEKSISTVKVLKTYALEIGIPEKEWDEGVNKAVDKHYGSKYDQAKTEKCHTFGNNPIAKAIYAECVESAKLYELSEVNL